MRYFYEKNTKSFYCNAVHDEIPETAIEISNDLYNSMLDNLNNGNEVIVDEGNNISFRQVDNELYSPITGNKDNYRIDYGNGLIEMGGIIQVECSVVTTGVIEGTHVVELPFSNLLHFDAVAMNVVDSPDSITGEDAFVTDVSNGFKIYATAKATSTHTIPVKWIAKGVM